MPETSIKQSGTACSAHPRRKIDWQHCLMGLIVIFCVMWISIAKVVPAEDSHCGMVLVHETTFDTIFTQSLSQSVKLANGPTQYLKGRTYHWLARQSGRVAAPGTAVVPSLMNGGIGSHSNR